MRFHEFAADYMMFVVKGSNYAKYRGYRLDGEELIPTFLLEQVVGTTTFSNIGIYTARSLLAEAEKIWKEVIGWPVGQSLPCKIVDQHYFSWIYDPKIDATLNGDAFYDFDSKTRFHIWELK